MTRRLQLLDPESRSSGRSASAVLGRIRDGLLRDNKVVPAVLGVLALLIFAWLVAGAIIGGPGDEEEQASNQASLAQGNDSDSGDTETPAPGVENRDSDASYGGYDEGPKDPFRQLIPKAGEEGAGGDDGGGGGDEDNDRAGGDRNGGGANGGRGGNDRDGDRGGGNDEDFIRQRPSGGANAQSAPERGGAGQGGADQGAPGQGASGQGGTGQAGGGLFNSGGDLPAP